MCNVMCHFLSFFFIVLFELSIPTSPSQQQGLNQWREFRAGLCLFNQWQACLRNLFVIILILYFKLLDDASGREVTHFTFKLVSFLQDLMSGICLVDIIFNQICAHANYSEITLLSLIDYCTAAFRNDFH